MKRISVLAIVHFGDNDPEPQRIRPPVVLLLLQYHLDVRYGGLAKRAANAMKAKLRVTRLRMALCM